MLKSSKPKTFSSDEKIQLQKLAIHGVKPNSPLSLLHVREAEIKFIGEVEFANSIWIGLELQGDAIGKHEGSVRGHRYFKCKKDKGIFLRHDRFFKLLATENDNNIRLGTVVLLPRDLGVGVVRYFGQVGFDTGNWVGCHLDTPIGDCDGSKDGKRYFSSSLNCGVFVRQEEVVRIIEPEKLLQQLQSRSQEPEEILRSRLESVRRNSDSILEGVQLLREENRKLKNQLLNLEGEVEVTTPKVLAFDVDDYVSRWDVYGEEMSTDMRTLSLGQSFGLTRQEADFHEYNNVECEDVLAVFMNMETLEVLLPHDLEF